MQVRPIGLLVKDWIQPRYNKGFAVRGGFQFGHWPGNQRTKFLDEFVFRLKRSWSLKLLQPRMGNSPYAKFMFLGFASG